MTEFINQFHFIRPLWLFCLIAIPFIWLYLHKKSAVNNDWSKVINPKLLKHLTPNSTAESGHKSNWLSCLIVALCVLSLAGPSWQQKPAPVLQSSDDQIIVLDLSLSVLATDVSPDRLTKAKQKLQDILNYRQEGNTALIVFSGDAHVVTPLTDDIQTILANMKSLDPFIMPVIGSRPDIAVQLALDLATQAKSRDPNILLITDGVEAEQSEQILEDLADFRTTIPLSVLAIGTAQGGPIAIPGQGYLKDNGQVILPKTDFSALESLANNAGGLYSPATLDDTDLESLGLTQQEHKSSKVQNQSDDQDKRFYDTWEDKGYVFLLILVPLVLIAHRKNMLLSLLLFFMLPIEDSMAFEWQDLWQTKDQQAEQLLKKGDPQKAAELFESPEHKAHAHYKAGQYDQAAQHYLAQDNLQALYNAGNALAMQNKYEEAIEKYNDALELNPKHENSLHNKAILEELLKQQQNQDQQNQDQQNQDQQNQDQQNQDQQNQEQQNQEQQNQEQQNQDQQNQDQQNQEQQNQDQQNQEQQNQEQQNQDQQNQDQQNQDQQNQEQQNQDQQNQDQQTQAQQDQEQQDKELEQLEQQARQELEEKDPLNNEEKQSYEQWMRRVPDDPGALLRRKFEQQAQERARKQGNIRKEGEPIW
ncbi:MAG: VWA domain-containing protein [Oleiphilus sp.]